MSGVLKYLLLLCNGKILSYDELFNKNGLVSIHHGNMHTLATEILNIKNDLSPVTASEIFVRETEYFF